MHKKIKESLLQIGMLLLTRCGDYIISKIQGRFWDADMYKTVAYDNTEDPRDYTIETAGAGAINIDELPDEVLLEDGVVLNQGPTMHCVAYGTTEGVNNTDEYLGLEETPKQAKKLVNYIRKNLDKTIDRDGTLIVNGPKGAKKLDWLDMYYRVSSSEQIMKALSMGSCVLTGSNKISWRKTARTGVAVAGRGGGHFICITGYAKNKKLDNGYRKVTTGTAFRITNTYGSSWGSDGHYWIAEEDLHLLYGGRYAIITDTQQFNKVNEQKARNKKNLPFKDVEGNPFIVPITWAKDDLIARGYEDGRLGAKDNLIVDRCLGFLYNYDQMLKRKFAKKGIHLE